jgi:hypothetical protein
MKLFFLNYYHKSLCLKNCFMIEGTPVKKLGKRRKLKYWVKHLKLSCTSHNCADVNFLFMLMFEYKYPQKVVETQETKLTKQRIVIHIVLD